MNKVIVFFILILMSVSMAGFAQEKELTLEDLIPGGNNYKIFTPKEKYKTRWFGNQYTLSNRDTMYVVNPDHPKTKKVLLTNQEFRSFLSKDDANVNNIEFTEKGGKVIASILLQENKKYKKTYFDIEKKQILNETFIDDDGKNMDFCDENGRVAFTKGNNLFISFPDGTFLNISNENNPEIIFGQEVYRNEFGIVKGTFWSPKGNYLAFYKKDESPVKDYPLVDISVPGTKLENIKYPMAGGPIHEVSIGIYHLQTGKTTYLKTSQSSACYFTNLAWSPDEKEIYIAELNRGQDTCCLVRYHVGSGERSDVLLKETNKKYIEPEHPVVFLKKSPDTFIWQTRRDGYRHLYLYNTNGKFKKQLTSGNWEVSDLLGFDEKEEFAYISSNEATPVEAQTYKVNLKTGKRTRLTQEAGMHRSQVSPNGKYLLDTYSNRNTPKNTDLINCGTGKVSSLMKAEKPLQEYQLPEISMGTIKADDGTTDLYYRLVKPVNFDETKKYPVIIYVYGGPHSQMVVNSWLYAARGWDLYMAQRGYVVFTLDNRGTSNRGLEFENIIHRNVGIHEAKDQMKGVEFLSSLPYVDSSKIGVHGWSYGGFMATNLMLRYPETFKVGVAGGPVIDWAYYEVMYGERYMDSPEENKKGYAESNLKNLAGNLKGHLLLIHDDMDPVVVWQHSLSFLSACIKARTYPDYFVYPGHEHNVFGADRVHLHEKITRYFDDYLKK